MVLAVKNPPTNTGDIDTVGSLGQEDPPEEGMAIYSSILAGEPQGQRSLVGCNPQGYKELDTTEASKHAHMYID